VSVHKNNNSNHLDNSKENVHVTSKGIITGKSHFKIHYLA